MYKSLLAISAAAALALLSSGCSTIESATPKNFNGQQLAPKGKTAVAHVSAQTHGLYLLNIPLITGSSERIGTPVFGADTVNSRCLAYMVTRQCAKLGGTYALDLTTETHYSGLLFYYRTVNASATAVK